MTRKTLGLDERLLAYIRANSLREHPALAELRARTAELPEADMQIAPEQGQFMAFLVELTGAWRILEVGCFTGYSALAMALAMPTGGRLITLDVNEAWVEIGRAAWQAAGVAERIEVRFGHALESLQRLRAEGAAGSFDLVFIDADKKNYDAYYEHALALVRRGGLILLDNVLWGGAVAHARGPTGAAAFLARLDHFLSEGVKRRLRETFPGAHRRYASIDPDPDRQTEALRALNAKLHGDERISLTLLPIADGLTLARKR